MAVAVLAEVVGQIAFLDEEEAAERAVGEVAFWVALEAASTAMVLGTIMAQIEAPKPAACSEGLALHVSWVVAEIQC